MKLDGKKLIFDRCLLQPLFDDVIHVTNLALSPLMVN